MKNLRSGYEKWYYIAPFALTWLVLIQVRDLANVVSKETIQLIPEAVTYSVLLSTVFSRFMWHWPIFRKRIVPFPNLQGTWMGHLQSTWEDPEVGKKMEPIPVQFCIKQSFEAISITMFTAESESQSQAALFIEEPDGTQRLKYTYTNKPDATVRSRSEIHEGAASLKIIEASGLELYGDYWTSRKSTGSIRIKRASSKLSDCFIEDINEWVKSKT